MAEGVRKMSDKTIWDFWAKHYQGLWVQRLSLEPTRDEIIEQLKLQITDKTRHYRILDIGCGTGQLARDIQMNFAEYDISIAAIDYSDEMIKQAKKNQKKYEKRSDSATFININYFKMDAQDIDTLETDFDVIICTHSLPYYKDQRSVIMKMLHLLRQDGMIYLAQASENNIYDSMIMKLVKLTTTKANYPSIRRMKYMTADIADMMMIKKIHVKMFMPSIYLFVLNKR